MHGTLEVLWILLVDEVRDVAIIKNDVEGLATGEGGKCLLDARHVFFLCLALPCEDGHASSSDSRAGSSINEMRCKAGDR